MNKQINKDVKAFKNADQVFTKLVTNKNLEKTESAITVKDLSFSIKQRLLLNKVNFTVKCGEIHGFIGPNGAGKTTTIKNIIDAYTTRSSNSQILIRGIDNRTKKAKTKIAYIPEYAAFPPHLSLIEYLIAMAQFSGFSKKEASMKGQELINLLELSAHEKINPNSFSSGMQKKVLLAQSLMTDPEVLILDEPAANLDPSARALLFKSLQAISKQGVAIFISSHILAELDGIIDSLTLIKNGNILYSGKVDTISDNMKDKGKEFINIFVKPKEEKKFVALAKKLKLEVKKEIKYFRVFGKTKDELFKLVEQIGKAKMEVEKIEFARVSLQDIYDKEFQ